jgi:hypothetical protein
LNQRGGGSFTGAWVEQAPVLGGPKPGSETFDNL